MQKNVLFRCGLIYKFVVSNERRENWKTTNGICVDCFFVDDIMFDRRYRRWSLEMFRDLRNTYVVIDYIHFLSSFSRFSSNRTFRRWKITSGPFNSRVRLLASSFLSFFLWHISLYTFSNRTLSSIWYSEYFLLYPRAKRSILVSCSKLRLLQSFSSSISYRFFFLSPLLTFLFFSPLFLSHVKENNIVEREK